VSGAALTMPSVIVTSTVGSIGVIRASTPRRRRERCTVVADSTVTRVASTDASSPPVNPLPEGLLEHAGSTKPTIAIAGAPRSRRQ